MSRDRLIAKAVTDYGYSQMELARFLALHYSTISRLLAATTANIKDVTLPAARQAVMLARQN
jgi:transposase